MDDKAALLQDIQSRTVSSKFNFVSVKEEPPEEIDNDSGLIYFENTERQFDFNSEANQKVHNAGPLVCIYKILVTVLFYFILFLVCVI
jgi:hypothetical protein